MTAYKPPHVRFPIGTRYTTRGKHPRTCTVVDVHATYSVVSGELVKLRYVATHEFAGQVVTDRDVPEASIGLGNLELPKDGSQ
jgi:hypothetical protein